MKLKIAKNLEFPKDAVTQTFAQVGRKGAGKTYLASMMAEKMLDIKAQVIIIDPIGNWWGLRVNADGKNKGKDIFVIGGTHGDIPLSSESGKEIAKILTEKTISVVLDISEFRKNERKKFVTDFAEEFFHLKKTRMSAVHLFLEEAQKFVPQRINRDETRMLGAWEDIVRLGRNYGIGCSLITQRPQSVNKEVLSQVECLCVLQITGLHERKALEEWIQEAGKDRKIVGELPSFRRGEGYVWSPSWLRVFQKVNFNKKTTLDTSATPELGKATQVAKISKIDIDKLRKYMSEVQEKKQKELKDLKDYKEEVLRLKRELSQRPKEQITKEIKVIDERQLENTRNQAFKDAQTQFSNQYKKLEKEYRLLEKKLNDIRKILGEENKKLEIEKPKLTEVTQKSNSFVTEQQKSADFKNDYRKPSENIVETDEKITGGAFRLLNACAMFFPDSTTKQRMATIAGISFKTGSFRTYMALLKRTGCIVGEGDIWKVTDKGLNVVGDVEQLPKDPEALIDMWASKVKGGAGRILRVLAREYPNKITKEELGDKAEISSNTGSFRTYIATLKRNGLIQVNGNEVRASDEFFE